MNLFALTVVTITGALLGSDIDDRQTGLEFSGNAGLTPGQADSTRFEWTTPPSFYPTTIIWKAYPVNQSGYFTAWFIGLGDGSPPGEVTDYRYVGMHPYNDGHWEVAAAAQDIRDDDNENDTTVIWDRWYTQAAVITESGGTITAKFYWDLSRDTTRVITFQFPDGGASPDERMFVGDAAWNPAAEVWNGILRGMQVYPSAFNLSQILANMDNSNSEADLAGAWYCNANWTPDDISDKCSTNNPAWVNANRPALWEGP